MQKELPEGSITEYPNWMILWYSEKYYGSSIFI